MAFHACDCEERNTRQPEIEAFRNALVDRVDPCCQPHIFEPVMLARENHKFTIRVTTSMLTELKNAITSTIEDSTKGLSIKNKVGDVIWPKPTFDLSPSREARNKLLGDWHKAIPAIVDQKGLNESRALRNTSSRQSWSQN